MELVAFRIAGSDTPVWAGPGPADGRFNRAGDPATQYLSLHPLGPWAERLRAQNRRSVAEAMMLRGRLWVVRVRASSLLDITFDSARRAGIRPGDLVSDDASACRRFADRCRAGGRAGLIVPGAALPGTRNLVLFGPRAAAPFDTQPIDEIDSLVGHAAEDARTIPSLVPLVRYAGMRHAEYEAWRRGRPFVFDDPRIPISARVR